MRSAALDLVLLFWMTLFSTSSGLYNGTIWKLFEDDCDEHSQNCAASAPCTWKSPKGFWYDLRDFRGIENLYALESPYPNRNVVLIFQMCPDLEEPSTQCNFLACLKITGIPLYNAGSKSRVEELNPPEKGINLVYEEGDICEKTGKSRKTIIKLPCGNIKGLQTDNQVHSISMMKAYEGEGQQACHYFVEFSPSIYGCPFDTDCKVASSRRWRTRDREIRLDSPDPPHAPPRPKSFRRGKPHPHPSPTRKMM